MPELPDDPRFNTYQNLIDNRAILYDEIGVSAGARGVQMLTDPERLIEYCRMTPADLIE